MQICGHLRGAAAAAFTDHPYQPEAPWLPRRSGTAHSGYAYPAATASERYLMLARRGLEPDTRPEHNVVLFVRRFDRVFIRKGRRGSFDGVRHERRVLRHARQR